MLARRTSKSSHCFVTLTDHTGELRTERNLRREMMTDSLTGLPNRAAFSELLEERIAAGDDAARYAVLIVDLDRFSRRQRLHGVDGRRRIADHRRAPVEGRVARGRCAGADRR